MPEIGDELDLCSLAHETFRSKGGRSKGGRMRLPGPGGYLASHLLNLQHGARLLADYPVFRRQK